MTQLQGPQVVPQLGLVSHHLPMFAWDSYKKNILIGGLATLAEDCVGSLWCYRRILLSQSSACSEKNSYT